MRVSTTTALCDWVKQKNIVWDVCATLHVPEAMRVVERGWTADWLSSLLSRYFNQLDRRIFKAAHRNREVRLHRWVTLEHSDGVGWHAHVLLQTPTIIDQAALITLAGDIWHRRYAQYATAQFKSRLCVVEAVNGNFFYYANKSAHDTSDHSKGILDLRNIHLPK